MMRYAMNLIGEAHSPMNNVNWYSTKHTSGDNNGKLHKLTLANSVRDKLCVTGNYSFCAIYNSSNL
jgi:hypothetical protein